ncbi:MAG: hypothetical protein WCQ72_04450, partial [Eubacteriales bacterium]
RLKWLTGMQLDDFNLMSRIFHIIYSDGTEEDVTIFYTEDETSTLISLEPGRRATGLRAVFDTAKANPVTAEKFAAYDDYNAYIALSASDNIKIVDLADFGLIDGTRFIANRHRRGDYILYLTADRDYKYAADRDVYDNASAAVRAYLFDIKAGVLAGDYIEIPDDTLDENNTFDKAIAYADQKYTEDGFYTADEYSDVQNTPEFSSADGEYTAYYQDGDLYVRTNSTGKTTLVFDQTPNADEFTYDSDGNITEDVDIQRYRSPHACGFDGHTLWYSIGLYEGIEGNAAYNAESGISEKYDNSFGISFISGGYAYGYTSVHSSEWYVGRFPLSSPEKPERLWEGDSLNGMTLMPDGDILTIYGAGASGEVWMNFGMTECEIVVRSPDSYEIKKSYSVSGRLSNSLTPYFADGTICLTSDEYCFLLPYEG